MMMKKMKCVQGGSMLRLFILLGIFALGGNAWGMNFDPKNEAEDRREWGDKFYDGMLQTNKEIEHFQPFTKTSQDSGFKKFIGVCPEFLEEMDRGFYRKLYMKAHRYAFLSQIEKRHLLLLMKRPSTKKEFRKNYLSLNEVDVHSSNYFKHSKIVNYVSFV